jgi:hypothetical protein
MVPKPSSATFNNRNSTYFRYSFTGATKLDIEIIAQNLTLLDNLFLRLHLLSLCLRMW